MLAPHTDPAISCDVAIVGGGPVGLTTALLLHALGHHVQVFEKHRAMYPQPRAVSLLDQAARAFDALGLHDKLDDKNILCRCDEHIAPVAEFVNHDGEVFLRAEIPVENSTFGIPRSFMLYQPGLEQALEDACRERGIKIFRSAEVETIEDKGDFVEIGIRNRTDAKDTSDTKKVTASFVAGCDGANSIVRKCAKIPLFVFSEAIRPWLIVDIIPKQAGVDPGWADKDMVRQYCDWARPRTSVPTPSHRRRWEFALVDNETEEEVKKPEFVWKMVKDFGCTPENAIIEKVAVYRFRGAWCDYFNKGRLVLAGDAAHLTPPFMAQGLNSGLRDAKALAWRLDLAIRKPKCNWNKLLEDYSAEQLSTIQMFIKGAVMLEKIITITDPEEAKARDAQFKQGMPGDPLPSGACLKHPGMFQNNRQVVHDKCIHPGCVFMHDRVEFGNQQGFLDTVIGTGWLLLGFNQDPMKSLTSDTARAYHDVLDGVAAHFGPGAGGCKDLSARYTAWFKESGSEAVLVRPDYCIYGTAKSEDEVEALVRSAIGQVESYD